MSLLAFSPTVRWCGCPVVRRPGGLMMFSYVRLCSLMFSYVRLYPLMRGNARSLRLPGRFGTVCRGESGPTLGLNCAAGSFLNWHRWQYTTNIVKRTKFWAAPAASIAGHVGPRGWRSARFGMPELSGCPECPEYARNVRNVRNVRNMPGMMYR